MLQCSIPRFELRLLLKPTEFLRQLNVLFGHGAHKVKTARRGAELMILKPVEVITLTCFDIIV